MSSTFIGGGSTDTAVDVALGPADARNKDGGTAVYITGYTASGNYPTTRNAYDRTYVGGAIEIPDAGDLGGDAYVTKIRR